MLLPYVKAFADKAPVETPSVRSKMLFFTFVNVFVFLRSDC